MDVKLESNPGTILDAAKVKNEDVVVVSSQSKQAVQDVVFGSVCDKLDNCYIQRTSTLTMEPDCWHVGEDD